MRVMVTGGRDFDNREWVWSALDQLHKKSPISVLIHGAATGADAIASEWAIFNWVPQLPCPADWDTHGKGAGPIRNHNMVNIGMPNGVVAFPGGDGTANAIKCALDAGVKVWKPKPPEPAPGDAPEPEPPIDVPEGAIFVFGSNRKGIHGAGAALHAFTYYGAERGVGEGPTGRAYAIPTKEHPRSDGLPLDAIRSHVEAFLVYAAENPELDFAVTRVGCGLAGYRDEDIAPMFAAAPDNCLLPEEWAGLV